MKNKSAKSANRKPPRKTSTSKPYWDMTTAELREATADLDKEFIGDTFRPPTAEQRARFVRAKRKRGRPRVGMGSKTISVTVEKQLLAQTDRLAKRLCLPRAALISRGLRAVVNQEVPV
jgi:hypothetical protein